MAGRGDRASGGGLRRRREAKATLAIPGMPTDAEKSTVCDTEADEMEEHLRGLGNLE